MASKFFYSTLLFFCCCLPLQAREQVPADDYLLNVETLAAGLEHPWLMVFLPEGGVLISERAGRLRQLGERIRDLRQAPDGSIWVLTDARNGKLLRLTPSD